MNGLSTFCIAYRLTRFGHVHLYCIADGVGINPSQTAGEFGLGMFHAHMQVHCISASSVPWGYGTPFCQM